MNLDNLLDKLLLSDIRKEQILIFEELKIEFEKIKFPQEMSKDFMKKMFYDTIRFYIEEYPIKGLRKQNTKMVLDLKLLTYL